MSFNLRALVSKLNGTTRSTLEAAAGLCMSRTHYEIQIEHLLFKLVDAPDCDFAFIAGQYGLDRARLVAELARALDKCKSGNTRTPAFSPVLLDALAKAWLYGSLNYGASEIRSGFVIVALCAEPQLSGPVRQEVPEMAKIHAEALQKDFAVIVESSVEAAASEESGPSAPNPSRGPGVFISYRREESSFYADLLFELITAIPHARVFRDTDTLKPGMVFAEKIEETVGACDFLLALIGKKWMKAADETGTRKLDRPDDWVRLEIAAALRQGKTVIPCLVGGAKMPNASQLPPDLVNLTLRHAVGISQMNFRRDSEPLIDTIRNWRRPAAGRGGEQRPLLS